MIESTFHRIPQIDGDVGARRQAERATDGRKELLRHSYVTVDARRSRLELRLGAVWQNLLYCGRRPPTTTTAHQHGEILKIQGVDKGPAP